MTRTTLRGALIGLLTAACSAPVMQTEIKEVSRLSPTLELPPDLPEVPTLASSDSEEETIPESLSAADAVRVALRTHRELRAMLRETGVAQGELTQAGLLPNPTFEVELLPERESLLELRLEYDLTSALLSARRAATKRPAVLAARFRAAETAVAIGAGARVAYVRAQAAEARLEAAAQVLSTFSAEREAAEMLFSAGNIPEAQLSARRAAQEQARLVVAELEVARMEAREQVVRALGLFGEATQFRLSDELADVPDQLDLPSAMEAKAVESSFALRESRSRLEALGRTADYTRLVGIVPDVELDVHALWRNPESEAAIPPEADWRLGGGVSIGIPLFDRRQGSVRSLESAYDAALDRHVMMATELRSQVREAHARLLGARGRTLHLERNVRPAREDLMKQTLLQYNAMQLDVFALLAASRQKLDAEIATIDAKEQYWLAHEELTAMFFGGRLRAKGSVAASAFARKSEEGH